jgi:hypothetical protein
MAQHVQGTGNLQRSKVSGAVTLGGSNGAASMILHGTRGTITVTLSAELGSGGTAGPISMTNSSIKASSVIESCNLSNHAQSAFDVHHVDNGSCKLAFINYSGGAIADETEITFAFMVYN